MSKTNPDDPGFVPTLNQLESVPTLPSTHLPTDTHSFFHPNLLSQLESFPQDLNNAQLTGNWLNVSQETLNSMDSALKLNQHSMRTNLKKIDSDISSSMVQFGLNNGLFLDINSQLNIISNPSFTPVFAPRYKNIDTSGLNSTPSLTQFSPPMTPLMNNILCSNENQCINPRKIKVLPKDKAPLPVKSFRKIVWEDQGVYVFELAIGDHVLCRRQDNNMINGTKLLNIAGISRGMRDGVLKKEQERKVFKIGPVSLKGIWLPFQRCWSLAQRFGILPEVMPIFSPDPEQICLQYQMKVKPSPVTISNSQQPSEINNKKVKISHPAPYLLPKNLQSALANTQSTDVPSSMLRSETPSSLNDECTWTVGEQSSYLN